ncbi:MAG: L-ribulose-5-phosphate 4-epimerase [Clostridia bacterium]|nr:L-ribulose-5-phosphate 4-epimerase [Clostridia bacterium]
MLEALKEKVYRANMDLKKYGLILFTWGNASERDPETGYIVIKPSGVEYDEMKPEDMVVVAPDGKIAEGNLRPSSDTPTHLEIYRKHPEIGGIVHTHSTYATAWAQAGLPIPTFGTTHADYFYGDIPCTQDLSEERVKEAYEHYTGVIINETFERRDTLACPACLVKNHGVFTWGKDAADAVYHAVVLEEVARMAYITLGINPLATRAPQYVSDKHYFRKHGKDAYYGQTKK